MHWLLKCRLLCQFGGRVASDLISKLTILKGRLLQLVLLVLALLLLSTSLTAAPLLKHPLAPPDTSSPQATLRSFVDNTIEPLPPETGDSARYLYRALHSESSNKLSCLNDFSVGLAGSSPNGNDVSFFESMPVTFPRTTGS